jgi:hypothetical protein
MRTLLLAALLVVPVVAALQPPSPGATWVVAQDTTLADVPFVLAQDVIILPGATLRLETVDALVARPVNITVRGTLELVEGTRLAAAALPYEMWVEPGATLRVLDATLVGALVSLAGTSARLENATLASGALHVLAGSASARDVAFSGSMGDLVTLLGGVLDIERATLDGAGGAAVYVATGGALRLANATVGQTGDYGVRVEGGTARIENATFTLSPSYAVYAEGATIDIVDSAFSTHCGAYLVDDTTGTIARNSLHTLDHGLTLVATGAVEVSRNDFAGTQEALLLFASSPDTRWNTFESNDIGVHVLFGGVSSPTLRDNSFTGNGVAIDHDASGTLDATLNWWGSMSGPATGDITGDVVTNPWLTMSPV